jgi:prophage regulatory protein
MKIPFSELPDEAFARLPLVSAVTGLSRATIYDYVAAGRFPKQIKLTRHAVGWPVGVIRAWLRDPVSWKPADAGRANG